VRALYVDLDGTLLGRGASLLHDGATWHFASDENRKTFRADPSRYAPQYGGYCAYAVAGGGTSGVVTEISGDWADSLVAAS